MLDTVAAVTAAICLAGSFITVENGANRTVAYGVHADLQPAAVAGGGNLGKMLGREQEIAQMPRLVGIGLDHHRRP